LCEVVQLVLHDFCTADIGHHDLQQQQQQMTGTAGTWSAEQQEAQYVSRLTKHRRDSRARALRKPMYQGQQLSAVLLLMRLHQG
jgi:hypothetical protein